GRMRTTFRAGFALMVIGSFVKGLMPGRAFVAGLRFTVMRMSPGTLKTPDPVFERSALIIAPMPMNIAATCRRFTPTWSASVPKMSLLLRGFADALTFKGFDRSILFVALAGFRFFA